MSWILWDLQPRAKNKVLGIGTKMLNYDLIFNYLIPRKIAELSKKKRSFLKIFSILISYLNTSLNKILTILYEVILQVPPLDFSSFFNFLLFFGC